MMIQEGNRQMEKRVEEEDIKGLEREIDSAVDRLFVDKKSGVGEKLPMEPIPHDSHVDKKSSLEETLLMEPQMFEVSSEPVMDSPMVEVPNAVSW